MGAGKRVRHPPNPLRPAGYRKSIRRGRGARARGPRRPQPPESRGDRGADTGGRPAPCPLGENRVLPRPKCPGDAPFFWLNEPFAFPLPFARCRAGAFLRRVVWLPGNSKRGQYGERRVAPRRILSPEPLSFRPVEAPGSGGKGGPGGAGGRTGTTLRGNVDLPGKAKGGRNLSRPAGDAVRTSGDLPKTGKCYRSGTGKTLFDVPFRNHSLSSCFFIPQVLITVYYKNSTTPCTPTLHPVKVPENITIYQMRI